jgi:hypothetical protein
LSGCPTFPDMGGNICGSFTAIQENLTIWILVMRMQLLGIFFFWKHFLGSVDSKDGQIA